MRKVGCFNSGTSVRDRYSNAIRAFLQRKGYLACLRCVAKSVLEKVAHNLRYPIGIDGHYPHRSNVFLENNPGGIGTLPEPFQDSFEVGGKINILGTKTELSGLDAREEHQILYKPS